jgi:geranylgeranyl diphosphate synthase type I
MLSVVAQSSFERALEAAITRYDSTAPITAMIRYHFGYAAGGFENHGKRLRPMLLLTVAEAEGGSLEMALDAACAIEILHNYSLVHDDIEDGDRVRHGRDTVWAKWGTAHGINAGDSLCAISYLALLESDVPRPAERTVAMTRALHEANLAMCAGQGRDIAFEVEARVTMDDYVAMIAGKTAALFAAACEIGALAAGAEPARARAYRELGLAYGIGFQIEDDLLGTFGESAATGKPVGADLARRKWTFPVVWALAGPPSPARDVVAARYARYGALLPEAVEATISALDALGVRDAAMAQAQAYFDRADAIAQANAIDTSGRVRAFLAANVRRVV